MHGNKKIDSGAKKIISREGKIVEPYMKGIDEERTNDNGKDQRYGMGEGE